MLRCPPSALLAVLALLALLAAPPARAESFVVEAPLARVVFDDPALEPWARRAAATADAALREVAALFGVPPRPAVLTVDDDSDVFNGFATVVPRDAVALRALFPVDISVGRDAADPLRLLLLHEVTHLVQVGWDGSPGAPPPFLPDVGLVGQGTVAVVPVWFVEGIATWVESETTTGGRRDDATSRGLLRALALEEGAWPGLADASLTTHADWPGGATRYLLGAAFVEHLVERYGVGAIPAVLDEVRSGPPWRDFSGAWRAAAGGDLAAEWAAWTAGVRAAAERAAAAAPDAPLLTESGGGTALPALSPGGDRLAWRASGGALHLGELTPEDEEESGQKGELRLERVRTLAPRLAPTSLAWLGDDALVGTALVRRPGSERAEVVRVDASSGRVETLTRGARAHLARPDPWRDGCLLFVRDGIVGGSELLRLCPAVPGDDGESGRGEVVADIGIAEGWRPPEVVWRPPGDLRIVGLAAHPARGAALALWRGGATRLALLGAPGGELRWLTGAAGDALDPVFTAAGALRFASDATGVWQIVEIDPGAPAGARRLTGAVGGADQPAAGPVHRRLGGRGWDLALLPPGGAVPAASAADVVADPAAPPAAPPAPGGAAYPVRRYDPRPSLAPYGWLPSDGALSAEGAALELSLYAQDDAGRLGSRLAAGWDGALDGTLGGAWSYLDLTSDPPLSLRPVPVLAWEARLGVWPHAPHRAARRETALGARLGGRLRLQYEGVTLSADARAGLLHLASTGAVALDAAAGVGASTRLRDRWGVPQRGGALALRAALAPTPDGPSAGVWLDAEGALPLAPLGPVANGGVASLRAGWRMPPPLPLGLADWAAVAAVGSRHTLPLALRLGDGLVALERVALEPTARVWLEAGDGGPALGAGGDLGVAADLVLGYGAPLRVGVRGGWARGLWWRWEAGVPF